MATHADSVSETSTTQRVPDLRGGFSHMVAALAAEGVSNVTNVQLISRGYEHFLAKLEALGADFTYTE